MGRSFHQIVREVIKDADILLMVVDARQPTVTVNQHLLELLGEKKLLYVINKIDLVPEAEWKRLRQTIKPSVAVSSTQHLGTMMLLRKINALAHGEDVLVGVIGYPNTGKSSLINAMRSRGSTSVSPQAGHTKAKQHVRVSKHVLLIDTPGVLPRDDFQDEERTEKLSFVGTIDVHKVKDPDLLVMRMMEEHPGMVEQFYHVPVGSDHEETLTAIAQKKNLLGPSGVPDVVRMAKQILIDYQSGKMR